MTSTPIFDELYAKYVVGAAQVRTDAPAHRAVTVPASAEPQPATGQVDTLMWPT